MLNLTIKNHPNFSHVFCIGLGCESAEISMFEKSINKHERIYFLTIQNEGGTRKIVDKVYIVNEGAIFFEGDPISASKDDKIKKFYLGSNFTL